MNIIINMKVASVLFTIQLNILLCNDIFKTCKNISEVEWFGSKG